MENEQQQHENGHSGGFLMGVLVGVILTLLITTKRGRKVMRVLTEEGFGKFNEWEDVMRDVRDALDDDGEDDGEMEYGDEYQEKRSYEPERRKIIREASRINTRNDESPMRKESSKISVSSKRFFRGVKKRG